MITKNDIKKALPLVLNDIQKISGLNKLPEGGTIAGQSVATLFYKYLGLPIKGQINDIDFFVNENDFHIKSDDGASTTIKKNWYERLDLGSSSKKDEYEKVFIVENSLITVSCSYKNNINNFSLIRNNLDENSKRHPFYVTQNIVNGFDINALCIGINLETKQVYFTQDFLNFCNDENHELKVVSCVAPAITLIRLAKKWFGNQIEGVICYFDEQKALLEEAIACQKSLIDKKLLNGSLLFGEEKYSDALKYNNELPNIKLFTEKTPENKRNSRLYGFDIKEPSENNKYIINFLNKLINKNQGTHIKNIASELFKEHFVNLYRNTSDTANFVKDCYEQLGFTQNVKNIKKEDLEQKNIEVSKYIFEYFNNNYSKNKNKKINSIIDYLNKTPIANLDNNEKFFLFINQKRNLNKKIIKDVADIFNKAQDWEKICFSLFNYSSEQILDWRDNKNKILDEIPGKGSYNNEFYMPSLLFELISAQRRKLLEQNTKNYNINNYDSAFSEILKIVCNKIYDDYQQNNITQEQQQSLNIFLCQSFYLSFLLKNLKSNDLKTKKQYRNISNMFTTMIGNFKDFKDKPELQRSLYAQSILFGWKELYRENINNKNSNFKKFKNKINFGIKNQFNYMNDAFLLLDKLAHFSIDNEFKEVYPKINNTAKENLEKHLNVFLEHPSNKKHIFKINNSELIINIFKYNMKNILEKLYYPVNKNDIKKSNDHINYLLKYSTMHTCSNKTFNYIKTFKTKLNLDISLEDVSDTTYNDEKISQKPIRKRKM